MASTVDGCRRAGTAALFCFVLMVALILGACAGGPIRRAGPVVEGRVSVGGHGVQGARVELVRIPVDLARGPEVVASGTSGQAGVFRIHAPPGRYLILARGENRFGFFGRNPVLLRERLEGIHVPLVPTHEVHLSPTAPGGEGISGTVLADGIPVAGARVSAYLSADQGLRGPGYARSDPTGADGTFELAVPPGTYFLTARGRGGARDVGRLEPGDRFGVAPGFPFRLTEGRLAHLDLEVVTLPDTDRMATYRPGAATLTGTIVDAEGHPVVGMRACLFTNAQLLDRPLVLAQPTGADGRFRLRVERSGRFYLGAREHLGAPPRPGDRVGFHIGRDGARVDVPAGGRLDDLVIVVRRVP